MGTSVTGEVLLVRLALVVLRATSPSLFAYGMDLGFMLYIGTKSTSRTRVF